MQKLQNQDYAQVLKLLDKVNINTLFARSVLLQTAGGAGGSVYADNSSQPRTFYITHPYGMSLLCGDPHNETFCRSLAEYMTNTNGTRPTAEWLQADPAEDWTPILDSILAAYNSSLGQQSQASEGEGEGAGTGAAGSSGPMLRDTRVNFAFDQDAYWAARELFPTCSEPVVRMSKEQFANQAGTVIPRYFWHSAEQFEREAIGFCLPDTEDNSVASAAFSAYLIGSQLEIGIETADKHRGKGYALTVSSRLIDYCLEHGLQPVWACRLANQGSYLLAQKLGFKPSFTLPYYYLPQPS